MDFFATDVQGQSPSKKVARNSELDEVISTIKFMVSWRTEVEDEDKLIEQEE